MSDKQSIRVVVTSNGKPLSGATVQAVAVALVNNQPVPSVTDGTGEVSYPLDSLAISLTVSKDGYGSYINGLYRNLGPGSIIPISLLPIPASPASLVKFDHEWSGKCELALRSMLNTGMAGNDGAQGQAVIDQMNNLGGIYAGGEFQPHHNGPAGYPTYGFQWFYVSYITDAPQPYYQIVEFALAPPENQ